MWITRGSYLGHIRIVLWVSGSGGLIGVTHFQPWYVGTVHITHGRCCYVYLSMESMASYSTIHS